MDKNNTENKNEIDRHYRVLRRRLKSSAVRDPNGSRATFRLFYQNGGRDYEEYRLWLQNQQNSISTSIPTDQHLNRIKPEPTDSEFQRIRSTSTPQAETIPIDSRFARPFNSIHCIRRIPIVSQPMHLIPTGTNSSARLNMLNSSNPFHQELSSMASSSPSISIQNWSISDVAQFIDRHFPEKNIAQKFIQQKIDGRTLPLLTEDHLMRVFKMKLGPALRLLTLLSNLQIQYPIKDFISSDRCKN